MADTPFPTNRTMRRAAENAVQPSAPDSPERELQLRNARRATHITRSFTPPEPSAYADKPASPQAAAPRGAAQGGNRSPARAAQRPEGFVPAPWHLPGGAKKTPPPPASAPPLEGEACERSPALKAPLIGELAAQRPEGFVPAPRHLPGGAKKTPPPPAAAPPLEGEACERSPARKAPLIGELAAQRPEGSVPAPRSHLGGAKKTPPPPAAAPPLEGEASPAAATGRTSPPLHRAGQAPSRAAPSHTKRRGKGKDDAPATPADVIRRRRRRCADAQDIADFLGRLAAMAVLLVILFGLAFGITPMADDDMAPRISAGDLLLYYRLANDWSNGDVMVFEKDGEQYVGRIVARGGDTVEVTDQATLVVNGSTVLENDIYYTTPPYDDGPTYPLTLAADEFFVLCDYREGARDSRWFGPVKQSEIKGKVITVVRRSGL